VANVVGGAVDGFFAIAGGLWGGMALDGALGLGSVHAIPCILATSVLGAIGGGAALQALVGKVAGK
jgi:hypothetical protein